MSKLLDFGKKFILTTTMGFTDTKRFSFRYISLSITLKGEWVLNKTKRAGSPTPPVPINLLQSLECSQKKEYGKLQK